VFGIVSGEDAVLRLAGLLRLLPPAFPGALLVVQHMPGERHAEFIAWLQRRTRLSVRTAVHRDVARVGCVYVAPPDLHLAVAPGGRLRLVDGPPEHDLRPAGDVLLRSLAAARGATSAAVLIGHTGADGASGIAAVRAAGGRALLLAAASAPVVRLRRPAGAPLAPLEALDNVEALGARMAELAAASRDATAETG